MDARAQRLIEAYIVLLKDVNQILGKDWDVIPMIEIKEEFNRAMATSLDIAR